MSDIFREVEEDVRKEKAQKFWKTYGSYVIGAGVVLFAGIGAWQLWERHQTQEREKAAVQFMSAQRITNPQNAANAFVDITAPKGYALVARLSQANAMLAANQRKEAIATYKDIAASDSGTIGTVARLRAGWALAEGANRKELTDLLAPLDKQGNAWRENAQEILAYADYRALDNKSAIAKYDALVKNAEAPDALRNRARVMSAFLKGGGAVNFGSVPPEAVPLPPTALPAPTAP